MASEAASRGRVVAATALSITVATLLLVVAVLPAEYGIDLTGAGRLLGLTALSEEGPQVITPQAIGFKRDHVEFVLKRYESIEYKYRIDAGASMLYSWTTTRPISSDFHSEPDGGPEGYAESFDQQDSDGQHGTYTAPFSGIHGWYWENDGLGDVTIQLRTAGFYSEPRTYFDGAVFPQELVEEP